MNGMTSLIEVITNKIRLQQDNIIKNMNKIKINQYNSLKQPTSYTLYYANGDVEVVNKIITSSYYDGADQSCHSYRKFYKINNTLYA